MLEPDVERIAATRAGRAVECTRAVAHLAGRGQYVAYAIEADRRPGQLTEHEADRPDRDGEHAEQERDADHLGQAHGALAQPYATDDEDGECAEARQRVEDRIEEPTNAAHVDHRRSQLVGLRREAVRFVRLPTHRLDDQCAVEALVGGRGHLGPQLLGARDARGHAARVPEIRPEQPGEHRAAHQGQRPVDDEQRHDRADQHDHGADGEG